MGCSSDVVPDRVGEFDWIGGEGDGGESAREDTGETD